jgi:hypothetical protein
MSNKKKTHYNIDALDSKGCLYNLAFGSRSDGKSYQVKHKKMVKKYIETGRRFILLRRWQEEIKSEKIEQYFSDVDVTGLVKYESLSEEAVKWAKDAIKLYDCTRDITIEQVSQALKERGFDVTSQVGKLKRIYEKLVM